MFSLYWKQFSNGIYGKPRIFPSRLFYPMHNIIPHVSQLNGFTPKVIITFGKLI